MKDANSLKVCFRNSVWGSEWNRHFPEFHAEILGVPREVGLKCWKIGITDDFFPFEHFCSCLVSSSLEIELIFKFFTDKRSNIVAVRDWPQPALVSTRSVFMTARENNLLRHSKVTLEVVMEVKRYRTLKLVLDSILKPYRRPFLILRFTFRVIESK